MRMRTKKWARPELSVCPYYIKNPHDLKGVWQKVFKNQQPIWLELGCGKGGFLSQVAINNPHKNFIGIDLSSDMLGVARRKIQSTYNEQSAPIDNVVLTWQNIERIDMILASTDNVERIFINFCNPWFKPTQYKKRLTHPRQLCKYQEFLAPNAEIWFKTDDDELFNHSVTYFNENGFEVTYSTTDLHNSDFEPNYKTEHELMFSEQGIKIKFLIAKL